MIVHNDSDKKNNELNCYIGVLLDNIKFRS
jgi:hypothetical protein